MENYLTAMKNTKSQYIEMATLRRFFDDKHVECELYTEEWKSTKTPYPTVRESDCDKMKDYIEKIKMRAKNECSDIDNYCWINDSKYSYKVHPFGWPREGVEIYQYRKYEPETLKFINQVNICFPDTG